MARWVRVASSDAKSKVLSHVAVLDSLDYNSFKSGRKVRKLGVVVELGSLLKTTGPGEDGSNRVR